MLSKAGFVIRMLSGNMLFEGFLDYHENLKCS